MIKYHQLTAIFSLVVGISVSFAAPDKPPIPTMPLVPRAPAFSSWTITFAREKPALTPGKPVPQLIVDREQSVTVVKTNRTYWEVTTLTSGKKTERWICNGIELIKPQGSDQICQVEREEGFSHSFNFSNSDFEGLEWVSLDNYLGIKQYEGKSTFAFGSKPAKQEDKSGNNRSAILSVDTQLPLFSSDHNGSRTYTYNVPPTSPLVPPGNFLKAFKEFGINFK